MLLPIIFWETLIKRVTAYAAETNNGIEKEKITPSALKKNC